ncbi:MAG: type 4a pilus biogenesis protein PilO [Balneolaceae bacterium]
MSYAIRNTIILLVVLVLILGTGFGYMHFIQKPVIGELEETAEKLQADYNNKRSIADQLPVIRAQYEAAQDFINNFDKALFSSNNPDDVFAFLIELSPASEDLTFNFVFSDSSVTDKYGIIRSSVNGVGSYRAVYNFINRIENSQAVQKINNITLTPIGEVQNYNRVSFNFEISSFYDRSGTMDTPFLFTFLRAAERFTNPFFPLIRDIPPNIENLTDVENSRLVGVTASNVFLINQNGRMVNLKVNDPVFLGHLENINLTNGRAVFRLNKGGIIEMHTLEVQR